MEESDFKIRIQRMVHQIVYSIGEKKIPYKICSLQGDILTIQRKSTGSVVNLNIKELHEYFTKETIYNTQTARKHITGYVYSPATAVINALIKSKQ